MLPPFKTPKLTRLYDLLALKAMLSRTMKRMCEEANLYEG